MKKLTITFIVVLVCLSQMAIAQVDNSAAKAATEAAAANFEALNSNIKALKEKAAAEFSAEQSAIDGQTQALAATRVQLESENAAEKDMMADKWPARVAAREKLVKDEVANSLRQQKLNNRKKAFEMKVAQMEQKVKNSYLETIQAYLDLHNSSMKSTASAIQNMTY